MYRDPVHHASTFVVSPQSRETWPWIRRCKVARREGAPFPAPVAVSPHAGTVYSRVHGSLRHTAGNRAVRESRCADSRRAARPEHRFRGRRVHVRATRTRIVVDGGRASVGVAVPQRGTDRHRAVRALPDACARKPRQRSSRPTSASFSSTPGRGSRRSPFALRRVRIRRVRWSRKAPSLSAASRTGRSSCTPPTPRAAATAAISWPSTTGATNRST